MGVLLLADVGIKRIYSNSRRMFPGNSTSPGVISVAGPGAGVPFRDH